MSASNRRLTNRSSRPIRRLRTAAVAANKSGHGLKWLHRAVGVSLVRGLFPALALVLAMASAASADSRAFSWTIDETIVDPGWCKVPLVVHLVEQHTTIGHFEGGDYGDFPASYRFGQHQVVGTTTFTTLDGSRSIELRYGGPLIRRNAAFLGTVDPVLSYTGTLTATDIYHGAFISTASGEGTVLNLSGTTTYAHTSVYVDGVRVSRSDVFVSFTGANVDHLCEYLLDA